MIYYDDLLGSKADIEEISLELKYPLTVFYIENATHGFYPLSNKTTKGDNFNKALHDLL